MAQHVKKVQLSCGDFAWFTLPPEPGDWIICGKCGNEVQVEPRTAPTAEIIEDDMRFLPVGKDGQGTKYSVECLFSEDGKNMCGHKLPRVWSFHTARERMHQHQMKEHTRFGASLVFSTGTRLPPGSPPNF